jgi:hypothetical protein
MGCLASAEVAAIRLQMRGVSGANAECHSALRAGIAKASGTLGFVDASQFDA